MPTFVRFWRTKLIYNKKKKQHTMDTTTTTSQKAVTSLTHHATRRSNHNKVYVEEGEVRWSLMSDALSIEEAKSLTLQAVELEYSLP